jgi:hypothetical protein
MSIARFASGSSKAGKRAAGRTAVERTPVTIRSSHPLDARFEQQIRSQLSRRLGHTAGLVERITVRFDDVNGPRGGMDAVCRIKVVMSRRPSTVVEKRAHTDATAFAHAVQAVGTTIARARGKHALAAGRRPGPSPRGRAHREAVHDGGELIGRRVGRGPAALKRALKRPEKTARAHYVDTAAPGTSASDRRAGGPYSARRNTMARTTRAASTLEDSRTRPSRKSTRRSANRSKPSSTKERAAAAKLQTPRARAARRG